MRFLPTGKQNFKEIREKDLVYVDKTQQMHELIQRGGLYFLSRPRRFGKSLLLSKFQHLFRGEKELFKGLYIAKQTDYDFEEYPVLHFKFSSFGYKVENLEEVLHRTVLNYAEEFNIKLDKTTLSEDFIFLVQKISNRDKPVVLLVDEYDKPITDFLTDIKK